MNLPTETYKYLRFVPFEEVLQWDVKKLGVSELLFAKEKSLREILTPYSVSVSKKEMIDNGWSIISKINFSGKLFLRDKSENKTYKGGLHKIDEGTLIYSKINVRHGCIYYHSDGQPFGVSSEYPAYKFDKNKVCGDYLVLVIRSNYFKNMLNAKTSGIAKARVKTNELLDLQIPLPTLAEQEAIIAAYNAKIAEAAALESQATETEAEIERYLMQELGVENTISQTTLTANNDYKFLKFVDFEEVERWDMLTANNTIFHKLNKANYPLAEIGSVFDFITRSWRRDEEKFRYVELSSVDTLNGITNATELLTKKAPSRATQKIKEGDLIIGTTRPYLKKFSMVNADYDDCVCSSGFQVVAPNEKYNLRFLYEYLLTKAAVTQFEFYMTGALYPAITNQDLRQVKIPIPPLSVQNTIVEHINTLKERIKSYKAEAAALRAQALNDFEQELFE